MFSFFKKKPPADAPARRRRRPLPSRHTQRGCARLAERRRRRAACSARSRRKRRPSVAGAGAGSGAAAGACAASARGDLAAARAVPPLPRAQAHGRGRRRAAATRSGWLAKLRAACARPARASRGAFVGAEIDDALYEDLEAALLQADAGVEATELPARRPAGARRACARRRSGGGARRCSPMASPSCWRRSSGRCRSASTRRP